MATKVKAKTSVEPDLGALQIVEEELASRRKQLEALTTERAKADEKLELLNKTISAVDGAIQQLELLKEKLGGNAKTDETTATADS